ncbi:branched-chain amino acid ABC transporter [Bacterioplanes sanyensis]|uniref:Branched-chain amino acid ABC transporter n=1 Tax=Bacterioplanes sanyensis TaxID=1249553 RepID=A0A222FI78_9GAMM|nr:AzlD domain-containing protein [Bacterioplanes sanyensis]ASP38194.1 branched-chain amino acid ABC transporter [Bacterioplanes sanyensis]
MIWASIVAMTLVVFASRYVLLSPAINFRLSGEFQQFMSYCAPAVLTAIWAPLVIIQDGRIALDSDNPYLIAAAAAILLALVTRSVLLTCILSMLLFAWLAHG